MNITGSHLKDKKITVLRYSGGTPPYYNDRKWEPLPGAESIWAYYRHVSGREYFAAAATQHEIDVIFEINWRSDVYPGQKVQYRGIQYNITQIDDFEGNKSTLRLFCKKP